MTASRVTVLFPPALLGLALLLAACGGGSAPQPRPPAEPSAPPTVATGAPQRGSPTPPTSPTPVDPLVADPPAGGSALDASRVDASGLPPGFPTLAWTRGPRTVGVYGRAGGCTRADAQLVEQTPAAVTIRVVQTTVSTGPCTRELRYPPLEVNLVADLGQRRVVLVGETR